MQARAHGARTPTRSFVQRRSVGPVAWTARFAPAEFLRTASRRAATHCDMPFRDVAPRPIVKEGARRLVCPQSVSLAAATRLCTTPRATSLARTIRAKGGTNMPKCLRFVGSVTETAGRSLMLRFSTIRHPLDSSGGQSRRSQVVLARLLHIRAGARMRLHCRRANSFAQPRQEDAEKQAPVCEFDAWRRVFLSPARPP